MCLIDSRSDSLFSHYFIGGKNNVNTAVLDLGTIISQIALWMISMTCSSKRTIINLKLKYISSCQFRWYQILINKLTLRKVTIRCFHKMKFDVIIRRKPDLLAYCTVCSLTALPIVPEPANAALFDTIWVHHAGRLRDQSKERLRRLTTRYWLDCSRNLVPMLREPGNDIAVSPSFCCSDYSSVFHI